ncbi:MAG TPA: SpoIIE family protein phosphatase [Acidimicrobiales bacterium]|jgi:anti-sigma regulatory factor (Ser/Thr protein kinase)|nr:SpoIIE family protein phosphatase [Acidimicrobiales bacterium]
MSEPPAAWADLPEASWVSFFQILDQANSMVVMFSGPDHRLVFESENAAALLGRREPGRPAAEIFPDLPDYVFGLNQVWATGETVRFDRAPARVTAPDGIRHSLLVDAVFAPVKDAGGRTCGVFCRAVDVTSRYVHDEQLRVANALNRVTVELTRTLDVDQVSKAVTRLAAEVFHGWGLLDLWQPDSTLSRVATTHHDPAMQPVLDELPKHPRISGRPEGRDSYAFSSARTGRVHMGELDPGALVQVSAGSDHARLIAALQPRYFMSVPVQVGPRRLGSLSVVRSTGDLPFTPADRAVLEQFGERAAIGLAHATDYSEQREAALTLQRSLLPPTPGISARIDVAVRYRAGGTGVEVGGDWYDLIELQQGAIGLVVGDVEGHDLGAAALMGQVRAVVRSHARAGLPPSSIAHEANAFVGDSVDDRLVTFAYIQVHVDNGLVIGVRAGHIPAVAVSPDGRSTVLNGRGGLPLGVDADGYWFEETVTFPPGTILALCTDGLVETPGRSVDEGLERLAWMLQEGLGDDIDALADRILATLTRGARGDDVALVLMRLPQHAQPADSPILRCLPSSPSSAPVARHFAADMLRCWGISDGVVDDAALLVTELVSNATRHSDENIELRMARNGSTLRFGVYDESHRMPVPSTPDQSASSGRGLKLVNALATAWGVDMEDRGKVVWFELDLTGSRYEGKQ